MGASPQELLLLAIRIAILLAFFGVFNRPLRSLVAWLRTICVAVFPRLRHYVPVNTMSFPPSLDRLKFIFRGLLIAEISMFFMLMAMTFGYGFVSEGTPPAEAIEPTEAEIAGMVVALAFGLLVIVVFLAALITAWIGLFQYRPWARWLYLGVYVTGCLISLLVGLFDFSFQWGLINAVDATVSGIVGCNVSLLLFSELSSAFDASAQEPPIPTATLNDSN
jgi:hypothetical protein